MSKNRAVKKVEDHDHDHDHDFAEIEAMYEQDMMVETMGQLIEASSQQTQIAFDLTKLIIEKSATALTEESIFSTFKRAAKVVAENYPLKKMSDTLG